MYPDDMCLAVLFCVCEHKCLRISGRRNSQEEAYLQEVYLPRSGFGPASGYAKVRSYIILVHLMLHC